MLLRGVAVVGAVCVLLAGCSRSNTAASNRLISAKTTMVTAWEVPLNPLTDTTLGTSQVAEQVRWGYKLFVDTPRQAPRLAGGKVSCANCHLNAGQRERALPLVGVAGVFPEYNARAARLISLADRVVDCFLRSENATGHLSAAGEGGGEVDDRPASEVLPTTSTKEVLALSAYITWLSNGHPVGASPAWRGRNTIAPEQLIPSAR